MSTSNTSSGELLLDTGGMGKVYRARHKLTGKELALKALHKAWQHDERAVDRLAQESRVLAELRHPPHRRRAPARAISWRRLLSGHGFAGRGDLAARLKDGPLPRVEGTRIVGEVASAVGFAHRAGVVHRDLKPANVLLDESGRSIVTDFGFAHAITPYKRTAQQPIS